MYFLEESILAPGEKIRRIRSYLGLRQEEITGGKITRNLISYIENGKTRLVKDTADIIVENINLWAVKKKMPIEISTEYLMRDEKAQADNLLAGTVSKLQDCVDADSDEAEHELKKAGEILIDWDIVDKKAAIFELAGDYYYKKNQFHKSYIHYLKAIENSVKLPNHLKTVSLYLKLGRCAINLENYREVINLNNHALYILEEKQLSDYELICRALFNNALAYKKLDMYDECLNYLSKLEEYNKCISESQYKDMQTLKANCYFMKGKYHVAERIYLKLIENAGNNNDHEALAWGYRNLADIYFKNNDKQKSIEYINKSIVLRMKADSIDLGESWFTLGNRLSDVEKYEEAEKAFLNALECGKKQNNLAFITEILNSLLDCYVIHDKESKVDELIKQVKDLWTVSYKKDVIKEFFMKASYYYFEKDHVKSKELLRFAMNIE